MSKGFGRPDGVSADRPQHGVDHVVDVAVREAGMERQAEDLIRNLLGHGQILLSGQPVCESRMAVERDPVIKAGFDADL